MSVETAGATFLNVSQEEDLNRWEANFIAIKSEIEKNLEDSDPSVRRKELQQELVGVLRNLKVIEMQKTQPEQDL